MGSYRANIEERLSRVEEQLGDEDLDSYTSEQLHNDRNELRQKLGDADDDN